MIIDFTSHSCRKPTLEFKLKKSFSTTVIVLRVTNIITAQIGKYSVFLYLFFAKHLTDYYC